MVKTGITMLDRSVQRQDRAGFVRTVEAMDWSELSAKPLYAILENAATLEALPLARRLAAHGQQRFPADPRFSEAERALAPPKPLGTSPASGGKHGRAATWAWLEANEHRYPGKWIAVRDGVLLGAEDDFALLQPKLDEAGREGTLVVQVLA
jgi:hypothetical protein